MRYAHESYARLRAAHVDAVQGAIDDHIGRLDWSRERIEHHQTERLRSLLAYAGERSPFHARRLSGIDASVITAADLARVPMMTKAQAQDEWDDIVTVPDLTRERAERTLAERVSTNSEPLQDEDRKAIHEAWDAPVHNLWGSTEIGVHRNTRRRQVATPRVDGKAEMLRPAQLVVPP